MTKSIEAKELTASMKLSVGRLPHGPRNQITDVPGVRVGHCTVDREDCHTGVTVILPPPANPFTEKLTAAAFVWNGFGKSQGLVQVEELGTLETPIALTNTLNVGKVHDAMVSVMLDWCRRDGVKLTSVNPVVLECNDSSISDIARRPVGEAEVRAAIAAASAGFAEGDVGAGRGTICYGMKGGIRLRVPADDPGGRNLHPWGAGAVQLRGIGGTSSGHSCPRGWRSATGAPLSWWWPRIFP